MMTSPNDEALRMTLSTLRWEAPRWNWTAERHGFGWGYLGVRGYDRVRVSPYAVVCGPCSDDYCTQWRVDDGISSMDYVSWLLDEMEQGTGND